MSGPISLPEDPVDWESKFKALVCEMQNVGSDMGIYPQAVSGYNDERDYKQRDGFKNGWNAAVMEYGNALSDAASRAAEGMNADLALLLAAGESLEGGKLTLNMNDTWGWALAWNPTVTPEQLPEVARLFRDYGRAGLLYWHSQQEGGMRSEFHDNNRMLDFVANEERIRKEVPDSNKRAYHKAQYTLGTV